MQIGSKVICINDSNWTKEDFLHFHSLPIRGHVYVVRSVFHNNPDPFCSSPLALVGIKGEMILAKDDNKNMVYMEAHFIGERFVEILSPVIIPKMDPRDFSVYVDEIQMKFYTPDFYWHDWENNHEPETPPCPYCDDESGECTHVLLNIDKSKNVCFSGYMYDLKKTDMLRQSIGAIIQEGRTPEFTSDALELIWQTAIDSYDIVCGIMNWDFPSYYDLLDERFVELGCTAYRYFTGNDNSYFDIYFAENPEETIDAFHRYIIDELKMH